MPTRPATAALALLLLLGCSPGHGSAAPPISVEAPAVLALDEASVPVIEVVIDGRAGLKMVVDTGASFTTLDRGAAEALGLEIGEYDGTSTTTGADGIEVVVQHHTTLRRLELGSVVIEDFLVTILDNAAVDAHGWIGLLGQDVLARMVVILDAQRGQLHLLPGDTDEEGISAYLTDQRIGVGSWAVAPVAFRPCPFLPLAIGGLPPDAVELELDTGASSTSLPMLAVDALGLEPVGTYQSITVSGLSEGTTYRLEDFGFYGLSIDTVIHGGKTDHGLLGMDVLGELIVVLEGPGERVWFHHRQADVSAGAVTEPGDRVEMGSGAEAAEGEPAPGDG